MTQFAKQRYFLVGLGGTFDHLHDGHRFFLKYAAELGQKLMIGLTTKKMLHGKKFANTIQPYSVRAKAITDFCRDQNIKIQITELNDQLGPTINKETKIRALCVTKETQEGAEKINTIREAATLRALPVFVANMVLDEIGDEIHSDRIRAGKISRNGTVYQTILSKDIKLSDTQKRSLSEPLGKVFANPKPDLLHKKLDKHPTNLPICVVGDESLAFFTKAALPFNLGIFDGHTNRYQVSDISKDLSYKKIETTQNPAGSITSAANNKIDTMLKEKHSLLKVDGEEDLLTASLILKLPLQSVIYYGQPNQGMVEVTITEQLKNQVHSILN